MLQTQVRIILKMNKLLKSKEQINLKKQEERDKWNKVQLKRSRKKTYSTMFNFELQY